MNRDTNSIREQRRKLNEERSQLHSKKQLIAAIQRKMKTTMIGAIASIEDQFGALWGHGKPLSALSPEEQDWRERWEETRSEILDKGNKQLRAAVDEVAQYTLTWNKFQMELLVKPLEKDDE